MTSIEFDRLDLETGFVPVPGKPAEITQKILSDTLDHEARTGQRTRILRIEPGFEAHGQHDHPYFEELLIFKGSLLEGEPGPERMRHAAPAFARREPGHMHGPASTDETCYLLEVNWYGETVRS